jgi:sulfate adenylyltransferase subunit 2
MFNRQRYSHLDALENQSVYIIREAYQKFGNLGLLWSIGKDSSVLLWLLRKAFFGHIPIPCIHVDTGFKLREMIEFRDRLGSEWGLELVIVENRRGVSEGGTFAFCRLTLVVCCWAIKKEAIQALIVDKG